MKDRSKPRSGGNESRTICVSFPAVVGALWVVETACTWSSSSWVSRRVEVLLLGGLSRKSGRGVARGATNGADEVLLAYTW